ncbi:lecithin-cholesterol acyltransferase-like 1 [Miscanthus floridulus]|uniref:lecithin-cholesterol acyltransferase-like 1 n=1 Tax=Miscanthus floridulus TaxID=154761 RepID=UPI0034592427
MKGKGWSEMWKNASDLVAHDYVQCSLEQMRLVYDPAANDYRNLPGVQTRVPNFGCSYISQLRALVEAASKKHHGRKAIILAHSYGGMVPLEFVRNAPLSWRRRYVKHLILVAPTLSVGFLQQATALATGPGQMIYVPAADGPLRTLWRSLETAIADLPSPEVFGHDELIVVTKQRNYSAYDMEDFLAAIGFRDGVEPFRRRMVPKMRYFQVPMTCINGVGNRTPRQLVFWEGDYDASPEIVYGDGDGFVNLVSILAFDREMRGQPGQNKQFKSVKIDKAPHSGLVTDEWAVKQVM